MSATNISSSTSTSVPFNFKVPFDGRLLIWILVNVSPLSGSVNLVVKSVWVNVTLLSSSALFATSLIVGASWIGFIVIFTLAADAEYSVPSFPFQVKLVFPFQFSSGSKVKFGTFAISISSSTSTAVPDNFNTPLLGKDVILILDKLSPLSGSLNLFVKSVWVNVTLLSSSALFDTSLTVGASCTRLIVMFTFAVVTE